LLESQAILTIRYFLGQALSGFAEPAVCLRHLRLRQVLAARIIDYGDPPSLSTMSSLTKRRTSRPPNLGSLRPWRRQRRMACFCRATWDNGFFNIPFRGRASASTCAAARTRSRSVTRTSQQIRRAADKLLPTVLRDTDGLEDEWRGIVSVFDGPPPEVRSLDSVAAEADAVRRTVETWLADGMAPQEIGVFVRTPQLVTRARTAIAGLAGAAEMTTAPMSLAKGLEFRAVVVMACDEGILPLDERVADAADEAELDDIYETERRLLYVACTRAREHLLLTGVIPASEYLADFVSPS
jgi:UvrD-like helicase C-terminal domain